VKLLRYVQVELEEIAGEWERASVVVRGCIRVVKP
jgi:hypothetical protein